MKKLISILICVCLIALCGCGKEIDDMAYVVAIGVDKTDGDAFEFTFAIGNPVSINSEDGGDSNVLIFETDTGDSIFTAGEKISQSIGQEVNFSHAELLVFSSDVASKGVEVFLNSLTRNLSQRPKLIPAVSIGTAKETLESVKSQFEANPEKYLKKLFENKDVFSEMYPNSREFLCRTKNTDGGIAISCISIDDSIKAESMAVFYSDKLVGAFDDIPAYNIIKGTAEDMSYDVHGGTLILNQRIKPYVDIQCDSTTVIKINIVLDGTVASINESSRKEELYKTAEEELKKRIEYLLTYSSKEAKADIFGFDAKARGSFLTWDDWRLYKWHDKFENAKFIINVNIAPEKTGLILK